MLAVLGHRDAGGAWLKKRGDTYARWDETSAEGAALNNMFVHAVETTYARVVCPTDDQVRQALFILCHRDGETGSAPATEEERAAHVAAAVEMIGDPCGGNGSLATPGHDGFIVPTEAQEATCPVAREGECG